MRRDTRDTRAPRDAVDATDAERDAELLTAYVDGVAELAPSERHRVSTWLARAPQAQADHAAVRALLDQLRALPPESTEPDWTAMERSIQNAVGREVPRPWWRSWKWLVPAMTLATAAMVLFVEWPRPTEVLEPAGRLLGERTPRDPQPTEDVVALWLDGAEVDVELSASDMLGDMEPGDDDLAESGSDLAGDLAMGGNLLPSTNLAWIDKLDDDALDRAEHWLARKKG
jgi:anti-sigma factor RsiW